MRGRKPKPTALLKLSGSWRGAYRKNEPVATGLPVAPEYLEGEALDMFNKLVYELNNMGVIGKIDENILILYAETWALCRKSLSDIGRSDTSLSRWLGLLLKFGAELGLSPSSRAKLQVNKPKDDTLESLINRQKNNVV